MEKTLCDGLIVNGDVSSAARLILAQIEQALEKGRAVYTINFAALFSDIGHNANPDEASRMSAMEKIENICENGNSIKWKCVQSFTKPHFGQKWKFDKMEIWPTLSPQKR